MGYIKDFFNYKFLLLTGILFPSFSISAQCTASANNGSYGIEIFLNPVDVVPSAVCLSTGPYMFDVEINYSIQTTGSPPANFLISLSGNLTCAVGGASSFPMPLTVGNGTTETDMTLTNSNVNGDCATDTPFDLGCVDFVLDINAKQISASTIGCDPASALATKLKDVRLKLNKNSDVEFSWITFLEDDTDYYLVEYLTENSEWILLDKIKGQGYSDTESSYLSILPKPENGQYYFKLREIDMNGDTTLLNFKSILVETKSETKIHPNPSNALFEINSNQLSLEEFVLYNSAGVKISDTDYSLISVGDFQFRLDLSNLPVGIYYFVEKDGKRNRIVTM